MAKSKKKVVDRASGLLISSGPEEIDATQLLLEILISECGWDRDQIVSRPNQWRVPSAPSDRRTWPVDVAIFDAAKNVRDEKHVLIICECKKKDEQNGIAQLKIYLDREPHATVGIWFNGTDHAIIYKVAGNYEVAPLGTPIPRPNDPLHPGANKKLLTYPDLRQAPSLKPLFQRIRNRVAAQDANVIRDEMILPDLSSLLLLKIRDEQTNRLSPSRALSFQVGENRTKTADRMKALLSEQSKKNPELFGDASPTLAIDDTSIAYVVEELQNYRMLSNKKDSISEAFQVLRGKAYKGEEGQFFTPPSVVEIAIIAIDPDSNDRIVDPACGSGSFLASALNRVVDKLEIQLKDNPTDFATAKKDWSEHNLFAIDKDSVGVRLSKAYLSMLGDGSTHVYKADALRKTIWSARPDNLAAMIPDGTFSVVVTNPPFGTKLKFPRDAGREEAFEVSRKHESKKPKKVKVPKKGDKIAAEADGPKEPEYEARDIGIVFLERCLNLLEDRKGRLAIVLPDTYLFSPKYQWLIQWICTNFTVTHSINVPIEAFEPHCRAKTSILVIRKETPGRDHEIIGSLPETFGENKHGTKLFRLDAEGSATTVSEDEMSEAAVLLKKRTSAETKLKFRFRQADARERGVLVASYYWRKPYLDALEAFAEANDCDLKTLAELKHEKIVETYLGHGSPKAQFKGRGDIPYIKVVDIKNWKVIENPKYFIPDVVATRLRRNRTLHDFDLITPTRASKNIGLLGVIMPWQTHSILTRELLVIRAIKPDLVPNWLILVMMSLKVVNEQFKFLVMMQMNREDLGARVLELKLPIPRTTEGRAKWVAPVQKYFDAIVAARGEYDALSVELDPSMFADRP